MSEQRKKPQLNMRYYNGEIDDDLPYTGVLNVDPETGPTSESSTMTRKPASSMTRTAT